MTYELKDWLKSINFNKQNLLEENPTEIKDYPPFVINKCLSGEIDSVLFANEMNMNYNLDKDMQYSFYLYALRKRKRYSPYLRKEKIDDIEIIKKYYGYSTEKASQVLKLLNKAQINFIKQKLETGGKNDKSNN